MAYSSRRFVSVFYDLAHEFPAVYTDDAALATWLRLLMIADAIWPAPAMLPRSVKDAPLKILTKVGLVIVNGDEFKIKGHDALRKQKREQAQEAARVRHQQSGRNADASADAQRQLPTLGMPSTAQHKSTHTSEGETSDERDERFVALAKLMEELTQKPYALANPFGKMAQLALEQIDRHGWEAFEQRARLVAERVGKSPGVDEILFGVSNSMRRGVETADLEKQERQVEIDDSVKRRVERTQLDQHFQHVDGPEHHPQCPACRGEVAV